MANQKTYSRRKKDDEGKKSENSNQIDLIRKCVQQPRTRSPGGPKRRTDFSLFFCSQLIPPCSSSPDLSAESHSSDDGLIVAKHVSQGRTKEISSVHLILCCQSQHEGERLSPEYSELQSKEAESTSNEYEQKGKIEITMESTPEKLHHGESKDICRTSLAGERLTCSTSINDHASLQCSDTDKSALLASVKSSSRFHYDLLRRGDINTSKQLAKHPAEPNSSDENDKMKSLSSSKEEGDLLHDSGRGKRKRKPKVHFDELTNPEESDKAVRRLKIMRYLGLAAPAGSPFTLPHESQSN